MESPAHVLSMDSSVDSMMPSDVRSFITTSPSPSLRGETRLPSEHAGLRDSRVDFYMIPVNTIPHAGQKARKEENHFKTNLAYYMTYVR